MKETRPKSATPTARLVRHPAQPPASLPADPIRDAILLRLAMPYNDLTKEAAVLVAARVPRELSDRFDLVAQVQKRNKQDVLADALRLYIAHVVEGEKAG